MTTLQTIGLLGGTFDPIHRGHIDIANEAASACQFERIIIIPNNQAPTAKQVQATPAQRLEMVKLATQHHHSLHASDVEIQRTGKSYTIDTLREFRALYPDASISFLLGEDAFHTLNQWSHHDEFLTLCHLIVINRNTHNKLLPTEIEQIISSHQCYDSDELHTKTHGCILHLPIEEIDVSSTSIRQELHDNRHSDYLDEQVQQYILKNNLYLP